MPPGTPAPSAWRCGSRGRGDRVELPWGTTGRDSRSTRRPAGSGIAGMRERALLVGGDMQVESRPDSGTRVRLTVPLEAADAGRGWKRNGHMRAPVEETMKVLIADDHGIVRSGLRMLLEQQADIEVVGEASDGAEARDMAIRDKPDLAILDVKMPKLTGLQATREIRMQAPDVAILILSMYDDERYLFEALKAGCIGVRAQGAGRLRPARRRARAVERGEPFLTPEAQRALIQDVLGEGASREDELTPREQEVVKLVAEAHTNREIAAILHLSEKTVENHRSNAMRKLGMRDRVELVRYAIRKGLIEP